MEDYKRVPAKALKKGDTFNRYGCNGRSMFASAEVVEICGAMIKIRTFGKYDETFSTEDFYAEVPLTMDEFRAKYETEAAKVVKTLKEHKLSNLEEYIGYHTMWNGWVACDPWEFGRNCKKDNIEVLGWFYLEEPDDRGYMVLDIGIVALDGDEKMWCHASYSWIESIIEEWENAHNE